MTSKEKVPTAGAGAPSLIRSSRKFEALVENISDFRGQEAAAEKRIRLDVFFFFSFDLVHSTELKKSSKKWVQVIRYFYGLCKQLVKEKMPDAKVWKLIGDEVVFYRKLTNSKQVGANVSAVYEALLKTEGMLRSSTYLAEDSVVSIKAVAWLSPILQEVEAESISAEMHDQYKALNNRYEDDDVQIKIDESQDEGAIDFLGPNIDAGFRIARFARAKQLVISPGLARYMIDRLQFRDRLRIIGYESLKGVAKGRLFPGIWYHENWSKVKSDFSYLERNGDSLIGLACSSHEHKIDELDEVSKMLQPEGYFFDPQVIDEIIALSTAV